MKLSIILPVYNEKATVLAVLDKLRVLPLDKEIIVVDDYSTDGSRSLLTEAKGHFRDFKLVLHEKNLGKGACIRSASGILSGDYVIIQDADMEQDPQDILRLVSAIEDRRCKAVFGRRVFSSAYKLNIRYAANKFFTILTDILYFSRLSDIMTGYKLIERGLFQSLGLKADRFDIEPEITAKLLLNKIAIKEIDINYAPRRHKEGKKIRAKDSLWVICALIKYRFERK